MTARELALNYIWRKLIDSFNCGSISDAQQWEEFYSRLENMSDGDFCARYEEDPVYNYLEG